MAEENLSPVNELGRQPDPTPAPHIASPTPSLLLYSGLLVFAAILLLLAVRLTSGNTSGFLLNLATEIIGAVIILILVERRFKASELSFIQGIPGTTSSFVSNLVSGRTKEIKAYVVVLSTRVRLASLHVYLSRPRIEAELLEKRSEGVILIGDYGMGKTTLLHQLILSQSVEVLKRPRTALVPVIVPVIRCEKGDTVEVVLRDTLQSYYPVKDRTFRHLLKCGRLMCIFDGLDESMDSTAIIERLKGFRRRFPDNVLFISSRPLSPHVFEGLGLERVEIPPLNEDEIHTVLELRRRLDTDV